MKYIIFSFIILASAGFVFFISQNPDISSSPMPPSAPPVAMNADVVIIMKEGAYSENKITIKKDQVVEFRNEGNEDYWPASNIHPSHGIYPKFDPGGPVKPGEGWSFKFDRVGTWKFHDHLLYKEIKGEVIVSE